MHVPLSSKAYTVTLHTVCELCPTPQDQHSASRSQAPQEKDPQHGLYNTNRVHGEGAGDEAPIAIIPTSLRVTGYAPWLVSVFRR